MNPDEQFQRLLEDYGCGISGLPYSLSKDYLVGQFGAHRVWGMVDYDQLPEMEVRILNAECITLEKIGMIDKKCQDCDEGAVGHVTYGCTCGNCNGYLDIDYWFCQEHYNAWYSF